MPYIESENGVYIYVEDINPGMGNPILFIHGWPVNQRMFEYQFDVLPRFGYRCIAMDLRGFGRSSSPWAGYTYDRMSDDVRAVVEAYRLRDFTLAGFSVGGAISIRYMARHGGHGVRKLGLVSAAAPVFTKRPDYPYGLPVESVNDLLRQTLADRPKMLEGFSKDFFAVPHSEPYMKWFGDLGLQASGHGTYGTLVALRDEDLRRDLPRIRVPTGIFHGAHDKIVPFESAQEMHRSIAGSQLYRFEKSGHGLYYDELETFNSTFLQFLQK